MAKVLIHGASDDLIEVDDIEGHAGDEFSAYDCWKYVHFDDGTVVKAGYDQVPDKGWVFEVVKLGEGATVNVLEPEMEDGRHYSDQLQLEGNFTTSHCYGMADGPAHEELMDCLSSVCWNDLAYEDLMKVFKIVQTAGAIR